MLIHQVPLFPRPFPSPREAHSPLPTLRLSLSLPCSHHPSPYSIFPARLLTVSLGYEEGRQAVECCLSYPHVLCVHVERSIHTNLNQPACMRKAVCVCIVLVDQNALLIGQPLCPPCQLPPPPPPLIILADTAHKGLNAGRILPPAGLSPLSLLHSPPLPPPALIESTPAVFLTDGSSTMLLP